METTQRYGRQRAGDLLWTSTKRPGRVEAAGEKRESPAYADMRESILYIVGEAGEPMKKSDIEDKATGSGKAIRAMCDQLAKGGRAGILETGQCDHVCPTELISSSRLLLRRRRNERTCE